jgi:hypothetical protein
MILEQGIHEFTTKAPSFDWASVSSSAPAEVRVYRGDKLVDLTYVHGPTHTWWSNNPLFVPPLMDGEAVTIKIDGPAAMRIECVGFVPTPKES